MLLKRLEHFKDGNIGIDKNKTEAAAYSLENQNAALIACQAVLAPLQSSF